MALETAAIGATLDAIVQSATLVQHLGIGWYRANREWEDFPRKVKRLRDKHDFWRTELERFGMLSQLNMDEKLQELQVLLEKEENRLKREEGRQRGPSQRVSCCMRLRLMAFPGELTSRIENVTEVLDDIPRILEERRMAIDALVANSSALPSGLPFGPDKRYVPLKCSESEVQNALESTQLDATSTTGPHVAVLHGPPGSGKTALAKSTALRYCNQNWDQPNRDGMQAPIVQRPQRRRFCDGVFYVACGPGVDVVTKYFELLQLLGLPIVTLPAEMATARSYAEATLRKQLMGFLRNKSMLIILDDVWETKVLESFVVPSSGEVKYLVTSQNANLWRNAVKVLIEKVRLEDARKILASHVELENAIIPPHLQEVADKLIAETEANPLALANLATTIGSKRSTDLDEWNASAQNLYMLLDIEDDPDTVPIFNERYPRSFPSSMTLAVESLPAGPQKLLFLATMFEGPTVPEVVILMGYHRMYGSPGTFNKWRNDLEDRALIEVQSACPWWIGFKQRTWSIHGLRKRFIRAKYQETVRTLSSSLLMDRSLNADDVDKKKLVCALCALYGNKELAETGAQQLGVSLLQFGGLRKTTIEPIVLLLNLEGSFLLARQVIFKYVCENEVDEDSIFSLLQSPDTALPVCWTIRRLASVTTEKSILTYDSQGIMKGLTALLAPATPCASDPVRQQQLQESAARALVNLSSKDCHMERIVAFPGILEGLTGLLENVSWKCQMWAAWTLANLAVHGENTTKIASSPMLLEGLGRLLKTHVNAGVQEQAARALAGLAYSSENKYKISDIPEILTGLINLLGKGENPRVQEHSAMALGNLAGAKAYKLEILKNLRKVNEFPSALKHLVNMLAMSGHAQVQEQAAMALGNLAGASRKMVKAIEEFPDVVQRLVALLSRRCPLGVQERAAMAIANLSVYWSKIWSGSLSEQFDRKILHLIEDFPEALERLVEMVSQDEIPAMRGHAAMALANLAKAPYNKSRIAYFPQVLERLVQLLWFDSSSNATTNYEQLHAARALGNLAAVEEDDPVHNEVAADIRNRILEVDGAVARLVKLQSYAYGDRSLQMEAEEALRVIDPSRVSSDCWESERSDIVSIPTMIISETPRAVVDVSCSLASWTSPTP